MRNVWGIFALCFCYLSLLYLKAVWVLHVPTVGQKTKCKFIFKFSCSIIGVLFDLTAAEVTHVWTKRIIMLMSQHELH